MVLKPSPSEPYHCRSRVVWVEDKSKTEEELLRVVEAIPHQEKDLLDQDSRSPPSKKMRRLSPDPDWTSADDYAPGEVLHFLYTSQLSLFTLVTCARMLGENPGLIFLLLSHMHVPSFKKKRSIIME